MEIRKVTFSNIEKLQKIGKQTFSETFAADNNAENMNDYLKTQFSKEKIRTELADKNSEFYFAVIEDKVIGYLKINSGPSQTEIKDDNAVEIERIYVLKEYHGQKVGQLLYNKAIKISKQKKADYVWLGVWEKNLRAIRFYKKNGFTQFDQHVFKLGNEEQTDIMMKLNLVQKPAANFDKNSN